MNQWSVCTLRSRLQCVMSERDYPFISSTHYWNIDSSILLCRSIKYCIEFLLLTCLICFDMLEMLLTVRTIILIVFMLSSSSFVRTNYGKSSLYFRGTFLWNSLHPSLYTLQSVALFKRTFHNLNFN